MTEPLNNDKVFICKLTDIILANLANEDFGVKELAHESGMSLYTLSRRLNRINKKTINHFIQEVRLQKALEMLQNGTYTASEVAYKVGFGSPAYFNKSFHKFFGYPPGKVKNGDANNPDPIILTESIAEKKLGKNVWRTYILSFPGILILALLLGTAGFLTYNKINKSSDGRISIAVMPFRNMTNDTIWNIWQEGIQECLISSLSNYKELKVRRKETINTLFNTGDQIKYASVSPGVAANISQKLDANLFIYGSIKQAGNLIRVDAELTDTRSKEVLKSFELEKVARDENILTIIDTLSRQVSNYLLISKLIKDNPVYGQYQLSTNSPEALRYNIYGDKAAKKGDFPAAVSWFLKAVSIDSNFFDPMIGLSTAYGNQNMMEPMLQWLIKYYNKRGQWSIVDQLWASWAYAYNFEPPEESAKYLKQLLQIDDQAADVYYLLGLHYADMNQYEKAIPEYKKALEISQKWGKYYMKDNWAFVTLGIVYHRTGQYRKERNIYKESEKYDPDWPWILGRQAVLSISLKDTVAANRYIEKYKSASIKVYSSTEADILSNLVRIYGEAGLLDKADECYRKSLSLKPDNPDLMYLYASWLIFNKQNLDKVPELMDKAMELSANKYDYYNYSDTKGWGFYQEGKYQEALEILQRTCDSAPSKLYSYKSHLEEVKKAIANNNLTAKSR